MLSHRRQTTIPCHLLLVLSLASVLAANAWAAESASEIIPRLSLRGIYTDNIFLDDVNPTSEFVTEVTPGVQWKKKSRRVSITADLALQILNYAETENQEGDSTVLFPQFRLDTKTSLIPNYFFLDLGGQYNQSSAVLNDRLTFDNINLVGDRLDYTSYRVSPYIQHQTGSGFYYYLKAEQSEINYDREDYSASETLSDTLNERYDLNVNNGQQNTRIHWSMSASSTTTERDTLLYHLSEYRSAQVNLDYRLSSKWSVVAKYGNSENFIDGIERGVNGEYVSGGFSWTPSNRFMLSATTGDQYQDANLRWTPSRRTDVELGYRNSEVGIIRGESYNAKVQWRARRVSSFLRYTESVTNEQLQTINGNTVIPVLDGQGNPQVDPLTGTPIVTFTPNYILVDDEFIQKRGEWSISYTGRKFSNSVLFFTEDRDYLNETTQSGESIGMNLNLEIPVGQGWRAIIKGTYRDTDYRSDGATETIYYYRLGAEQRLGQHTRWGLYGQRTEQDSERNLGNYEENRAVLEWIYRY
mgnify:CR=1 FL=1